MTRLIPNLEYYPQVLYSMAASAGPALAGGFAFAAPQAAFGGAGGSFAPEVKLTVRKDFPETFIWENLGLNSNETSG